MNMKIFYNLLATLLGYGLIIGGFIIFGKSLDDNVRILDIIVSCLIFTHFVQFTIFPLVNLKDSANKEVGMMGIHFYVLTICCILSIIIIVCGIIFQISFKYQLMLQLVVLFILLIGRVATLHAGKKVQQIHHKEQTILASKTSLKLVMDDFIDDIAIVKDLDPLAKAKLSAIQESMGFIAPSSNPEAEKFDSQFCQIIEDLRVLMRNPVMNNDKIIEEVGHLERVLLRRKNTKN